MSSPLSVSPESPSDELRPGSVVVVRAYLGIAAAMVFFSSAAKHAVDPSFVNPPLAQWGVAAMALAVLGATFLDRISHVAMRRLIIGFGVLSLVWVAGLMVANRFDPDVAGAYYMVVVGAGAMMAALFGCFRVTGWFMGGAFVVSAAIGLWTPEPEVSPVLFSGYVGATAAVMLLSLHMQVRLTASLLRAKHRYAEAEAAGGIGSWVLDMATREARWSDGLCALLGVPPLGTAPAPSLDPYLHPDDLRAAHAAFAVVAKGDLDEHAVSCRITAVGGRQRTLRGVVRAERDGGGRVVRIVGVATDVTAQAAHQAELVEALNQAEAAARLKEAILANMSHEIRTPLTAVIGYAELLAEVADEDTVPLVEPIVAGGQRLLDTLNSVLDLARLEADGSTLALRPVDLAAAAERARAVHAEAAARAGLSLGVAADGAWVLADEAAVGRILDNLISNALRFTEAGGVTVRVTAQGDCAVLEVMDTGRGMSAGFTARAADAFVQESSGDARSHEGFGLGLTIVDRLVEAMHGRIRITSAPGAGTRVRISLPTATPEALAVPLPEEPVWVARRRLAPIAAKAAEPA